jgi:hypothetical protein
MTNDFKEVVELPEFKKDFKKLLKRFHTLDEDLQNFISAQLIPFHKMGLDNNGIFRLTDLGFDSPPVFKAKKFACRALKGKGVMSGIRVIYAYFPDINKIVFIEIYFKGNKESENRKRILDFIKGQKGHGVT